MGRRAYVCLYDDLSNPTPKFRVQIERQIPTQFPQAKDTVLCSPSPIFSVADDPFLPQDGTKYRIVFCVHRQPFAQLGKVNDEEIRRFLWYSLGITSIVAIFPNDTPEAELLEVLDGSQILCREVWVVEDGVLEKGPSVAFSSVNGCELAPVHWDIVPLGADLQRLMIELRLNFDSLVKRTRLLMPSLLHTVGEVVVSAVEQCNEIIRHEAVLNTHGRPDNPTGEKPHECGEATAQEYLASYRLLNVSVDALIQLNSGLAYILSQNFYGGPPLARNLSLNGSHSLLGIGTAITGIQRLTEFIIGGFATHPLGSIIKPYYRDVTLRVYLGQTDGWPDGRTPDYYTRQVGKRSQTPKLAYFSTRMGFSEHRYCVTASSQSLSAADTARRNLLTLTHELLHAHVKGLFATILAGREGQGSGEMPLVQLVREYRSLNKRVAMQPDWTIVEFLRFRIFVFCDSMYRIAGEFPGYQVKEELRPSLGFGPDTDDFAEGERFKNAFGF